MFKSSLFALAVAAAGFLPLAAEVPNPSYGELSANFAKPPKTARAGVYWYFMDGNLSCEGATKDLEAMSKAGIGYVIFLEVGIGVPRGKVDFMSEEWMAFFKHVVKECERLDIRMVLGTGPGWCGSGGPWVKGADSMRHLMSSSVTVEGGGKRTLKLPVPPPHRPYFGEGAFTPELRQQWLDYYEDVAVLAFPEPAKDGRIADSDEKAHYTRAPYSSRRGVKQFLPAPAAVAAPRAGIDRAKVVDLTGKLRPDGTLEWDAPAGRWTVMRFGARNNGAVTRPAPRPGLGFECDKFDGEALKRHFANFQDRLFEALGPRPDCFGGLKYLHIDSWEMGAQNWSYAFRAEFTRRRGYDPLPFYPAWDGRIVGDENLTERFLWDLRRTSQELILENHVLASKRYAHAHGLKLSIEPYDMNPTADLEMGVAADIPMGEFWHRGFNTSYAPIEGVSAAHVIGQPVVPAESFTSHNDAWRGHPAGMKNQNDWAMAIGLNRLFFHTFQHQCLPDHLRPGMTMGPYGVHWDRNQTWWPMANGYHTYLSRCQYMLQQGRSVADILYLAPESTPHVFRPPASALDGDGTNMPDRKGHNFDGCPPSVFLKASVRNGKVVLPGGAEYSIVELPQYATATPQMMEKYRELAQAGATLVGVPPMQSPSLTDYPACDEKVRAIARELWGEAKAAVRQVGKGRICRPADGDNDRLYESYAATAARLAQMGLAPDFASDTGAVRYHHRTAPAGDLYFVASRSEKPQTAVCSFRIGGGRTAEVWNALDGTRCTVASQRDGQLTKIKLDFAPHQSYFVVFSEHGTATAKLPSSRLEPVVDITGAWKVEFQPPTGTRFSAEFPQLSDWKDHANPDIRHFSGIAVYEKRFDAQNVELARRTWLSLGKVCNMARVTLNGKELGIQWTDPWRVETTGVLQAKDNVLRIEVANLWTNRLVGDAQLPNDGPSGGKWPEWVLKGTPRPTQRVAFQSWNHYNAKSPLESSGLLGPVKILSDEEMKGVVLADYTKPDHGWVTQSHATNGVTTAKGFSVESFANDPWLVCPAVAFPVVPPGTRMLTITLTTEPTTDARDWQLFTAGGAWGFSEAHSAHLAHVEAKPPYTRFVGELPVADLPRGKGRLRLDPPGHEGAWTVKSLTVDFTIPIWEQQPQPPPPLVIPAATPLVLAGKNWELRHDPKRLGAFRYLGCGKLVENNPAEPFVYLDKAGKVCQLDWAKVPMTAEPPSRAHPGTLVTKATTTDAEGRTWALTRRFSSVEEGQSLTIYTHLLCRDPGRVEPASVPMLHVPFLTLFVERGSAGHKRQAMLAGVEYLDDEPSSSKAEIRTHESDRRIPAEYRMSAPLAVFTDDTSWLGFRWGRLAVDAPFGRKPGPAPFATVFDSPDRMFRSGGHLLAFWAPNVGPARRESSLAIERAVPLQFGQTRHAITIRAGVGADVATALETLVPPKTYALPPVDKIDPVDSLELLSLGWLDSSIRDGLKLRHAVASHFASGKIGDGPVLMNYLAAALARKAPARTELPARLRRTAGEILASLTADQINNAPVSHVRRPAPALVSGNVTNRLNRAAGQLEALTRSLASGKQIYHAPTNGRADMSTTLGREFCNGFASMPADVMLGCATWSGNEQLIERTLAIVDKFTALYHGTVPRGAQPWEMPLHTPDLMASAHLTRVYALAYLLKPDPAYLREARHWAYTGLSMIYLQPPPFAFPDGVDPIGTYATCAVMGATSWTKPNWIGRPVQWCGLVYSAALWDLARIDQENGAFWHRIASGITASGVRQTHPRSEPDKVGLLPDSFNLEKQSRYPCPINPGTVEENLAEYLGLPFYAVRAWPKQLGDMRPSLFHLAGAAQVLPAQAGVRRCRIDAWPETESRALLTRLAAPPQSVMLEGRPLSFSYYAPRRTLVIVLPPKAQGELCVKE